MTPQEKTEVKTLIKGMVSGMFLFFLAFAFVEIFIPEKKALPSKTQEKKVISDLTYVANNFHQKVLSGEIIIPGNPGILRIEGSQEDFWCGEFTQVIKLDCIYKGHKGEVFFVGNGQFWFYVAQKIPVTQFRPERLRVFSINNQDTIKWLDYVYSMKDISHER